jgi:hypothetical protein
MIAAQQITPSREVQSQDDWELVIVLFRCRRVITRSGNSLIAA